jgi:hypothetical protein
MRIRLFWLTRPTDPWVAGNGNLKNEKDEYFSLSFDASGSNNTRPPLLSSPLLSMNAGKPRRPEQNI